MRDNTASENGPARMCASDSRRSLLLAARAEHILALDEALADLEKIDPQQSRVVELRFFGGLTEQETAEVLGIGVRTVTRELSLGKAWLYGQLQVRDG